MIRNKAQRKPKVDGEADGTADAAPRRAKAATKPKAAAKPKAATKTKAAAATPPSFRRERALLKRGIWPIAGCDEVGRGPLAGPVVAAAVILDPDRIPKGLDDSKRLSREPKGLDDSKRLSRERREALFEEICATASFSVAVAPPSRIERDNILRASLWALARAVHALPQAPQHVFVDGRDRIDVPCGCDAVIGGDGLVVSIAAASIVAKVVRDRLMGKLAEEHPGYGFEQHMGYGVPLHLAALDELGPTAHHRRLFAPVAAAWRKHGGDDLPEEVPVPDAQADLFDACETRPEAARNVA